VRVLNVHVPWAVRPEDGPVGRGYVQTTYNNDKKRLHFALKLADRTEVVLPTLFVPRSPLLGRNSVIQSGRLRIGLGSPERLSGGGARSTSASQAIGGSRQTASMFRFAAHSFRRVTASARGS
jgi:hypothetical protein